MGFWDWGKGPSLHKAWHVLDKPQTWEHIQTLSYQQPQLIFKHSTRCSISSTALARMESALDSLSSRMQVWYLDLITHRGISNQIAADTQIEHESPQVIVLWQGKAVYSATHSGIRPQDIPSF